jgi:RNA polymerase sigma-70 factor (sigma-E family)
LSMGIRKAEVSFEDFVRARSGSLLRTAFLLAGQNRVEAEDLLQLALERAYRHWGRVCRAGEPERYVRRILVNASADRWRRMARRAERPLLATDPGPMAADRTTEVENRDYLLRALAGLTPRQRTVLVLRYFDDLSEIETAQMLGCSVGTVKSHAARGLARLREAVSPEDRRPAAEARAQPMPVVAPEGDSGG